MPYSDHPDDKTIDKVVLQEFEGRIANSRSVSDLMKLEKILRQGLLNGSINHELRSSGSQALLKIQRRKNELMGIPEVPAKAIGLADSNYGLAETEQTQSRKMMVDQANELESAGDKKGAEELRKRIIDFDTKLAEANEQIEAYQKDQKPIPAPSDTSWESEFQAAAKKAREEAGSRST